MRIFRYNNKKDKKIKMQNLNFQIYTTKDWNTKLQVNIEEETVWLNQEQMAVLFGKSRTTITGHIKNIFEEWELDKKVVCQEFQHTTQHWAIKGKTQNTKTNFYNLEMIISVWYRVRSNEWTQFRKWATSRLKEYIVKGFTMDDERLKQWWAKSRYFEELLQRIRDIRSSERNFYQKVTDIYAMSVDYKIDEKMTKNFFASVQNKMHFAVHWKTAAELIDDRVDSEKELLGLTNFKWEYITIKDVGIAKNYLLEEELKELNLIVSMYLDFAELQATNWKLMKMQDWINKLEYFLIWADKEILKNSWNISHKKAIEKAKSEYEKYREKQDKNYISDFDEEIKKLKKIK